MSGGQVCACVLFIYSETSTKLYCLNNGTMVFKARSVDVCLGSPEDNDNNQMLILCDPQTRFTVNGMRPPGAHQQGRCQSFQPTYLKQCFCAETSREPYCSNNGTMLFRAGSGGVCLSSPRDNYENETLILQKRFTGNETSGSTPTTPQSKFLAYALVKDQ